MKQLDLKWVQQGVRPGAIWRSEMQSQSVTPIYFLGAESVFEEYGAKEQARREAKRDRERRELRFAKLDERRPKPRCVCRCVASVGVLKLECEGSELNAFPATVAKDIPALNCGCGVRCITRG